MKALFLSKIIIFDLDDTLYSEKEYVLSGFKEIACFFLSNYKLRKKQTFNFLLNYFNLYGRKFIFNSLLREHNKYNKKNLMKLVSIYRNHNPKISISKNTKNILEKIAKKNNLYLVTDGNKLVQRNKIKSLKITNYFKKIFITHQYGLIYSKPSLFCFRKIKNYENTNWSNLVYIGDDPNKDFINLNSKGCITIRINSGRFKNIILDKKHEAKYMINSLNELFFLDKTLKLFNK